MENKIRVMPATTGIMRDAWEEELALGSEVFNFNTQKFDSDFKID